MDSAKNYGLMEAYASVYTNLQESHYNVGDEVVCKSSGMTGKVVKVDSEEKGKYYTVKREDGKTMKYAPDELKKGNGGAPKDKEEKFHTKLDKLVHNTFGSSPEEKKQQKEETDLFDYVLDYLVSEGYADTNENALVIMVNMSEEWRGSVISTIFEMDDFAAGGGNAKMKQTGMTKDQVIALGKKNLSKKSPSSSSSDSSKPSKPATTDADYKIAKLRDKRSRDDEKLDAIAAGKSPAAYRRKQNQMDADSGPASASEKQREWDRAGDDAENVRSWTGSVHKDYQKHLYNKRIAARNNDPDYDPSDSKNQMPTSSRAKRSSRDAWNSI